MEAVGLKLMGILNVTPDSFSDGGVNYSFEDAVANAKRMVSDGVDVLDVGGESTRPGSRPPSAGQELERVVPVIKEVSTLGVPVSVDSYKLDVVEKALDAGASMVNDVYGLQTKGLADLVARHDASVCIMHMQGTPQSMQVNPGYGDVVGEIKGFLERQAALALEAGIGADKIIVDPGIGFGKALEHNLEILRRVSEFKELGYPVLVGHSRKSFIGGVLGLSVEKRLHATLGVSAYLALQGVDYLRVHDVREHVEALGMVDAVLGGD